jgi:hypothetical protein
MFEDVLGDDLGEVLDMINEADEVEELDPDDPDLEELTEEDDCYKCNTGC